MGLEVYKCSLCQKVKELFDDELEEYEEIHELECCTGKIEKVDTSFESGSAITEKFYQSQWRQYESVHTKVKWNQDDMKQAERDKNAELFSKNAYK